MGQSKKYHASKMRSAKRASNLNRPRRLSMIQERWSPQRNNGPKLQRILENIKINPIVRSPKFTKSKRNRGSIFSKTLKTLKGGFNKLFR